MLKGRKTDNFSMRIYLETIENIVGPHGLKSVLNYAHLEKYIDNFPPSNSCVEIPLEDIQSLCLSLLEMFGQKGVRSLQLRVGRQLAQRSLSNRPLVRKAAQLLSRVVPEHKKMRYCLTRLIEEVKKRYPLPVDTSLPRLELHEEEDCFIIIYRDNWESEDVISQSPVCNVAVGTIEALMEWITGHIHEVQESECRAMGHPADVFRISKFHKKEDEKVEKRSLDSPFLRKNTI